MMTAIDPAGPTRARALCCDSGQLVPSCVDLLRLAPCKGDADVEPRLVQEALAEQPGQLWVTEPRPLGGAGVLARFTRSAFVDVLHEDYIRTARAKGVSEVGVVLKHGLRNALIPVVTMMGLQFGFLLGGSIVVEKVFNWPGMGRLLVDAVEMRDYPVIQAEVLLFSLQFILINLSVDMLYGVINPTIRYK